MPLGDPDQVIGDERVEVLRLLVFLGVEDSSYLLIEYVGQPKAVCGGPQTQSMGPGERGQEPCSLGGGGAGPFVRDGRQSEVEMCGQMARAPGAPWTESRVPQSSAYF